MRKLSVSLSLRQIFSRFTSGQFSCIERIEILEVLKENTAKGYNVGIAKITLKKPHSIDDVTCSRYFTLLHVFERNKHYAICLVRVSMPERFSSLLSWVDCEVVWERPIVMTSDTIQFSCTGTERSLRKVEKYAKILGNITAISYELADYRDYNMLRHLSEKEREVLQAAIAHGYYEYPRKVSATTLASELRCSKLTTIEFLRRAENKVIAVMVQSRL